MICEYDPLPTLRSKGLFTHTDSGAAKSCERNLVVQGVTSQINCPVGVDSVNYVQIALRTTGSREEPEADSHIVLSSIKHV